jgi:hypothetical protein
MVANSFGFKELRLHKSSKFWANTALNLAASCFFFVLVSMVAMTKSWWDC